MGSGLNKKIRNPQQYKIIDGSLIMAIKNIPASFITFYLITIINMKHKHDAQ